MAVSRRDLLRTTAAGTGAAALSGCGMATRQLTQPELPEHLAAAAAPPDLAHRTLNRFAFGPRPGELELARTAGAAAWLDAQLRAPEPRQARPLALEDTPAAELRVRMLDTMGQREGELLDFPKEQVQRELQQATVLRAVYSRWQLREVMADFWNDHFNVSQTKGDSAFLRTPYDAETIHANALGRFRDLLGASARSPAMLYYLDSARNRKGIPNENYARELMELHTLGVDGGYTQRDVYEVARCFTGWAVKDHFWRGRAEFRPGNHDSDDKIVLGTTIRGRPGPSGAREGDEVLDLLARHRATAHFVARKLCRRFLADDPPETAVRPVAEAFRTSDGQIGACLRALAATPEFRAGHERKLKRPFDFVASALRALNANTDGRGPLRHLALMGQLPFHWAMPDGYPDAARAWSTSLLARWNFALALVNGQIAGTTVDLKGLAKAANAGGPAAIADAFTALLIGVPLPEPTRAAAIRLARNAQGEEQRRQVAALLIASPEFQWR